jgi:hypothetical protein
MGADTRSENKREYFEREPIVRKFGAKKSVAWFDVQNTFNELPFKEYWDAK